MEVIQRKKPILVLNIQINDFESEKLEIFNLTDMEEKINHFCKIYSISSIKTVKKIKKRVKDCLKEKYPFLVIKENKPVIKKLDKENKIKTSFIEQKEKKKSSMIKSLVYKRVSSAKPGAKTKQQKKVLNHLIHKKRFISKRATQDKKSKYDKINKSITEGNCDIYDNIQSKTNNEIFNLEKQNPGSFLYQNRDKLHQSNLPNSMQNNHLERKNSESMTSCYNNLRNNSRSFATRKSNFCDSTIYRTRNMSQSRILKEKDISLISNMVGNNHSKAIIDEHKQSIPFKTEKEVRQIFNILDEYGKGRIGPKNLNLKALTAKQTDALEFVIIEIFKGGQYNELCFDEFFTMVRELVKTKRVGQV